MIKILTESFQDVDNYLTSYELKEELNNLFPSIKSDPSGDEFEINSSVVNMVKERYPDEPQPTVVDVTVIKVLGDETEVVSTSHQVVEFNGVFYDYTATRFSDSYNNLISYNNIPVTQQVVTNDRQINDGVSSVKSYALLKMQFIR